MNVYDQVEDDHEDICHRNLPGLILNQMLNHCYQQHFDQSTATSDQGADLYQNQEGNSATLSRFKQMFDGFNKDDNNTSYTTSVTVKSIMPGGDGKSNVVYDVKLYFQS